MHRKKWIITLNHYKNRVRAQKIIVLSGNICDKRNLNVIVNTNICYVNYDHIIKTYTFDLDMQCDNKHHCSRRIHEPNQLRINIY